MPARRVLMLAHHFPPAGGSGSNRALAFGRYLPAYGWEPVVVTPGTAWASPRDDRLLAELPPGLRVIRTRSLEPRPAATRPATRTGPGTGQSPSALDPSGSAMPGTDRARSGGARPRSVGLLRSNLGHLKRFPDAHLGWVPFALAAAQGEGYAVAYSSSGPFTSHVVGLVLKRLTGRPWVAELRDGWYRWNRAIFPDYPAWRDHLERRLEAVALRTADRVVLVTERMADAFRQQYPDLPASHFSVVPNGFDRAQIPGSTPTRRTGSFEIVHAGALYYGRSLAAFLEAARRLIDADPNFANQFRLTLIGTLDASAQTELAAHAVGQRTTCRGQLDHDATLQAMRGADALLLVANTTPGAEATVPGKLFEYLAVGRPIVAVAPPESSTADLLGQTGGGWLAPSGDPAAIACSLDQAFRAHQTGRQTPPDPAQVARFDRRLLAGDLAAIFNQVLAKPARAARRF
jgi:glycosyltransferase involved in cell wall biosynthesis